MTLDLMPLADAVLPLIRTSRRDLWRYAASNEHGAQMRDAVTLLEVAIAAPEELVEEGVRPPTPTELYTTVHKALASALKVIARADDSAGIIGDVCRDLIDMHAPAAAAAQVKPVKLADWVFDFHFDDEVDYFELDPVAYAPALGEEGLARLRQRVEELRFETRSVADGPGGGGHASGILRWFDKRFAVLDRDVEAIVRTHLGDGRVAAWHEDVAEAFEEIGELELAIEWAHRAVMFDRGHQARRASRRWWELLEAHRPNALPEAARTIFRRWPDDETGARLVEVVGPEAAGEVQVLLEAHPAELVRFQLGTLRDVRLAWQTAHRLHLGDDGVWWSLAQEYQAVDVVAALGVQVRVVAESLVVTNQRRYRPAAADLGRLRRVAREAGSAEALALVDGAIAELRERYRRRPTMIAAFDRAGLP